MQEVISIRDAAWAAGFFEGDGSFTACKSGNSYSLRVTVSQVNREPLERLKEIFGGSYSKRRGTKVRGQGNGQDFWQWAVAGPQAENCIKHVQPFLSERRLKQSQTALMLWRKARTSRSKSRSKLVYVVGRMAEPKVTKVANELRTFGFRVFDDWHAPGPEADVFWREYEEERGRDFVAALEGAHAKNVFEFDRWYLDMADIVVLVEPAGKSAHMELGYASARGKQCFILSAGVPEKFDIMARYGQRVDTVEELVDAAGK